MIEIIKSIIDLIIKFINSLFNFQIDFVNGENVSIGIVAVAFVSFVVILYFVLSALGIVGKDDD